MAAQGVATEATTMVPDDDGWSQLSLDKKLTVDRTVAGDRLLHASVAFAAEDLCHDTDHITGHLHCDVGVT